MYLGQNKSADLVTLWLSGLYLPCSVIWLTEMWGQLRLNCVISTTAMQENPDNHRAGLTLRPGQIASMSQTTVSNAFYSIKFYEFRLRFHWILFLMVQLTIFQNWLRWWLGFDQVTNHHLNQWWLDYRRINASLNELSYNVIGLYMPDHFQYQWVSIDCKRKGFCAIKSKYYK